MDSMIDRVAREICLTMWGGYPVEEAGREQWSQWEVGRNLARVVIKVMREPTEAMLEEGPPEPYMDEAVWSRMIDAALTEKRS